MPVSHSHQLLWVSFRPAEPRDQHGVGGIGDVPDLMRLAAEGAQHVDRVGIAFGQCLAVADAHHLPSAALVLSLLSGNVMQISGIGGIGDVDDRGSVRLGLSGQGVDGIGNSVGAAVMADIGDPAVALVMDGRLIGAARLQVVASDQPHVGGFRRRADHLLLRGSDAAGRNEGDAENCGEFDVTAHAFSTRGCRGQSVLADFRGDIIAKRGAIAPGFAGALPCSMGQASIERTFQ